MYEALCKYAKQKKTNSPTNEWDGNVPANYRTQDNPQKSLGRWVNRQRSSYSKNSLCKDHIDKLNKIGLRWAVHEKKVQTPNQPSSGIKTTPYSQSKPSPSAPSSSKLVPYNAISGGNSTKITTPTVVRNVENSGNQTNVARSALVPDAAPSSGATQLKATETKPDVSNNAKGDQSQMKTSETAPCSIKSSRGPLASTTTAPAVPSTTKSS